MEQAQLGWRDGRRRRPQRGLSLCERGQVRWAGRFRAQMSATRGLASGLMIVLFRFGLWRVKRETDLFSGRSVGRFLSSAEPLGNRGGGGTASQQPASVGGSAGVSWRNRPTRGRLSSALGTNAGFPHPAALGCGTLDALERHSRHGKTEALVRRSATLKPGDFRNQNTVVR